MLRIASIWLLPLALAACAADVAADRRATNGAPAGTVEMLPPDPIPTAWREIITDADLDRLDRADDAWETALAEARSGGFSEEIDAEQALLDPAVALPRAAPPPGPYACRVVKLGSESGERPFTAFKTFGCYVEVEGELLTIVKESGSERPAGRLWPEEDARMVFLGAMELGQEEGAPAYAADSGRDLAGFVERVAPFRWRMVVPWPPGDANLAVFELVPIPPRTVALDGNQPQP